MAYAQAILCPRWGLLKFYLQLFFAGLVLILPVRMVFACIPLVVLVNAVIVINNSAPADTF